MPVRAHASLAASACAVLLAGCGGGAPLLHPAHTLPQGKMTAGAGVSGNFVVGEGVVKTRYPDPQQYPPEQRTRLESFARRTALAPGVSPWVGARIGLGGNNEAGITYHGRSLRADARHAFGDDKWALSVGAGASAVLSRVEDRGGGTLQNDQGITGNERDLTSAGWGLDVPVLFGYRSTASVAQLWVGARGGIERLTGEFAPLGSAQVGSGGIRYEANSAVMRYYGGGLVGAAVGFRPFWVALELNVAYQYAAARVDGPGGEASLDMSGLTIAPAGALIGKF